MPPRFGEALQHNPSSTIKENIMSAILTQMDRGSHTQSNAYWGFFKEPLKRKSELRS